MDSFIAIGLLVLLILPSVKCKGEGSSDSHSDESGWLDAVPGIPNIDYPMYKSIPVTNFSCVGRPHNLGFHVDYEARCQLYHICYNGQQDSFLCPVGTLFDQKNLACSWWFNVQCSHSDNPEIHSEFPSNATVAVEIVTEEPIVATPYEADTESSEIEHTLPPPVTSSSKFPEHHQPKKTFVSSLKKPGFKVYLVPSPSTKSPIVKTITTKHASFQKTQDYKINSFPAPKVHSISSKVKPHSVYKSTPIVYSSPLDFFNHFLLSKVRFLNELLGAKQKVISGSLSANELKYRPHLKSDLFKVYVSKGSGYRPQKITKVHVSPK